MFVLFQYLDKIGQIFFGVPPPKSQSQGGFLGNLINSLLGDDGDSMGPSGTPSHTPVVTPHTPSTEQKSMTPVELD